MTDDRFARAAAELRADFDRSFAEPPAALAERVDLLGIRVGGDAYAIRLDDAVELATMRRVVPVPADTAHLLGVAAVRGRLVPVFGLASILGYLRPDPPRWLLVCGSRSDPIALGFSDVDGHLQVAPSAIHAGDATAARYVRAIATARDGARGVLDVVLVVNTIRSQSKER